MDWKKIGKALLYPPTVLRIVLIPVAAAFLVLSMVFLGTKSIVAILAYVLAAYTLTVWCLKIPCLIGWFKRFKSENKYLRRWKQDARLRVNVTLYGALIWNGLYGFFQLWLGIYHRTFWFCSLGAYYICLSVMRFFLFKHTRRYAPGEKRRAELVRYCTCGWIFLLMNLALALIVFFMLYWDKTFTHDMITAIMMAAYTFTAFTIAIVNMVRYKKYKSPVFSASKAISLTAACVSMLTLTSTMLTTFNDGTMDAMTQKILLSAVGFSAVTVVIVLAIYMIVVGNKKLKEEVNNGK